MIVRDATAADLPQLVAIINEAIVHTTARWTEMPETLESGMAWLDASVRRGLPVIVGEQDGTIAGFGSLASFRTFSGFRYTIEHSVYVHARVKRRGLGRVLLAALEERARTAGYHVMVGTIGADNEGSLALHRQAGFIEVGRMPEIGFKFGRWLDMVIVQKML